MSAGNPHTSYSDVTCRPWLTKFRQLGLVRRSHRQRQFLPGLIEFKNKLGVPDMLG